MVYSKSLELKESKYGVPAIVVLGVTVGRRVELEVVVRRVVVTLVTKLTLTAASPVEGSLCRTAAVARAAMAILLT